MTFTVAEGITVEFSPGLMYWDGDSFEFESSQTEFSSTWNENHVNHFSWSKDANVAVAETYDGTGRATADTFFTNKSGFTVNGQTGWRTLSKDEWSYLLKTRVVNGGTGYGKTCKWGAYSGVNGLIIAHDDYTGDFSDAAAAVEVDGCVFLPAAGHRLGTNVNLVIDLVGDYGLYWSATPLESTVRDAYGLNFYDGLAGSTYYSRPYGFCVRLVR